MRLLFYSLGFVSGRFEATPRITVVLVVLLLLLEVICMQMLMLIYNLCSLELSCLGKTKVASCEVVNVV